MTPKPSLINLLLISLPLLAVVLVVANILAHNLLATSGGDLKSVESQAQILQDQNSHLHQHIASLSSLIYLRQQAQALGFTSPLKVVYLNLGQPLAQR